MTAGHEIKAWRPPVAGVAEVLHARFTDHAYPMHVHDTWTLLIVDTGAVRYDLAGEHVTPCDTVTLLPPHVPHNGAAATADGFRKRVVYLDEGHLDPGLVGAAADGPDLADPHLRRRVSQLHTALTLPGDELEAESLLALIGDRIRGHLRPRTTDRRAPFGPPVARALRELLDARVVDGVTLGEAARLLHTHPSHLVRVFSGAYGMAPHQYLTSRRVDLARRLLLDGSPPGRAAVLAGFFDQAHFTRHFKRTVGVPPGRFVGRRGRVQSRT